MATPKDFRNPRLTGFEPMWSIADVADYLHVSTRTVERIRTDGDMPLAMVFGRSVRWEPSSIRTWARGAVEAA